MPYSTQKKLSFPVIKQGMTAFYESKYFQERLGVSKAMSVIKTLEMWDVLLHFYAYATWHFLFWGICPSYE